MKKSKRILMMIGFYFLSFTWGFIMSFIGLFVVLGSCLITKTKPKRFGLCAYNIIGEHWGGSNCGFGFISDKRSPKSTYYHEHGHGLQNIIFGPLMPFVVCTTSAVRHGLFDCDTDKDKIKFLSIFCSLFALAFFYSDDDWYIYKLFASNYCVRYFVFIRNYFYCLACIF